MTRALRWRDSKWAIAGLLSALLPCLFMWGFTVDDALISVRYARHLAAGLGYRFNDGGAVTDGVTPLPWAFVLAPLAGAPASALDVLMRAKCMGLVAWSAVAVAFGVAVGRAPGMGASGMGAPGMGAPGVGLAHEPGVGSRWARPAKWAKVAALVTNAVSLPVAAHAVSGMETGLAMALAAGGALAVGARSYTCAVLAGCAAALRPEMAPWAAVLAFGAGWGSMARRRSMGRAVLHAAIALVPFASCAAVRVAVFGRPAPLAVLAKPSDVTYGALYAAVALMVAASPVLVLSPRALARAPRAARVVVAAAMVHVVAIVAVGGDWMPYARLFAPVAPSLAWAYVLALPHAHRIATALRAGVAIAAGAVNFVHAAPLGRAVMDDRRALVERARPYLDGVGSVAAVDIGWISAATEGRIVDLAGVTDPDIAVLPGGHTSKRVDPALLLSKNPDALLFYIRGAAPDLSAWPNAPYGYLVEARLAHAELLGAHFAPRAFLPLGHRGAGYFLLTRRRKNE
ncbi:hypothetical protein [Pendulispora albinea]|uniref:Glycosyltransferase RgtA/B/C/D-like domain-containing protein n=1 Tax=Pendulispora albinea TaxID=2741071 RepID=A0ABZ2M1M1_9BACT